jgi:hypothetical protein
VFLKMRANSYFREFQKKILGLQSSLDGPGAAGAQTQAPCREPGIQQILRCELCPWEGERHQCGIRNGCVCCPRCTGWVVAAKKENTQAE